MLDNLKKFPARFLEWWNKFSSKQKTIIISVAAGVIVALAILVTIISKTQYSPLTTCNDTKESSEVKEILEGAGIDFKVSSDGLTYKVSSKQLSDANIALGANNILPNRTYTLENALSGGFSTTESDKQKKYAKYLEKQLEEDLSAFKMVRSAVVNINVPKDEGTLISRNEDISVGVSLDLKDALSGAQAQHMAQFIKCAMGNASTENIMIMDNDANIYYSGSDDQSAAGNASSQISAKQQAETIVKSDVKNVLQGTGEFGLIEVSPNLDLDFALIEETNSLYSAPDGQTQGVLSHESLLQSDSTGGSGGVPGAEANDNDTTYVFPDTEYSNSSILEYDKSYLPNQKITNRKIPPGAIKYENSSIAVAATNYKVVKEKDAKAQGLLDGLSWQQYKLANSERVKIEVDEDMVDIVSKATGIDADRISFIAYQEYVFIDKPGIQLKTSDVIQIALIVIILGLLGFVVYRSMRSLRIDEQEEELSVESLLQSTPQSDLENIEFDEKSESRKIIEKFVDENPEAVASLLRNWLNEDWG